MKLFVTAAHFEELIAPHLLKMYQVAYRLTGSVTDAEDLVQDVLVKIFPKRRQLVKIDKLSPWLIKVLYRTFIDQHRRKQRSPLHLLTPQKSTETNDILDRIPTESSGPEENVQSSQTREQIAKAIGTLTGDHRDIIVFHDMEGYTLSELVDILEAPLGTLKSRLHRARANLRKLLEEETFRPQ